MKKLLILLVLLGGCAITGKPIVLNPDANLKLADSYCEDLGMTSAGQAMSNVQHNLDEKLDWDMMVNCSPTGCLNAPILGEINNGESSGPNSQTNYRGLGPRAAFDAVYKDCMVKRGYKLGEIQ